MDQILSLELRPKSLNQMVGQKKLTNAIKAHYKSGREPRAWLFIGDTGAGKTTLARILALSVNCTHQQEFGSPCEDCYQSRTDFNIYEINASEVSGIDAISQIANESNYMPHPPSKKRVYILDEAHQLSSSSQNALLKYFEDAPKTTLWIICTTDPHKILKTLRSRCLTYAMSPLTMQSTTKLLERVNKRIPKPVDMDPLLDQLLTQKITSPRLVLMAVEKFLAGTSAEEAIMGGEATVDTLKICRAVVKGDWETVKTELANADSTTVRVTRAAVGSYMKTILIDSQGVKQTQATEAIMQLAEASRVEEGLQVPYTLATLYKVAKIFQK